MKIDAHQHFWSYNPGEYGWIGPSAQVLRRDFLPVDLQRVTASANIQGVVSVQARQNLEETNWLLELAHWHAWIRGVVGWLPLTAPDAAAHIATAAAHPKLKAVRHVLQDESDDHYLLREDFNRGIRLLGRHNLAYDLLIFERHLPQTITFVDQHPNQIFVLDHLAKPRIKERIQEPWRKLITDLAARPNVYCKLSGIITEADHQHWTPADLHPYLQTALNAFGPRRLMFGSDWPVCLLAGDYLRWTRTVEDFIAPLAPAERNRIMGETAIEAYRL